MKKPVITLCPLIMAPVFLCTSSQASPGNNQNAFDLPMEEPWGHEAVETSQWYGMQTLGTSLGSLLVTGLGIGLESIPLTILGVAAYYLGPTMIHLGHNRSGPALGSFLVHLSAPTLGAAVFFTGFFFERDPDAFPQKSMLAGVGTFAILGIAALAVDTAVFANPAPEEWAVPQINYNGDRVTAGLAMRF